MRFLLSSILLILISQAPSALARTAYDCANPATSGSFSLSEDCTLSGEVSLSGDLDILGVPKGDGSYPVITAAASSRHFKMDSVDKLTLKYLKMVDGDVYSNEWPNTSGGSIYARGNIILNISDSEFFNNKGSLGGAISFRGGQSRDLFLSSVRFTKNHGNYGGAFWSHSTNIVDHSCTYTANTATRKGGAVALYWETQASFFGSSFINNTVADKGGAINAETCPTLLNAPTCEKEVILQSVTLKFNKQTGGGTDALHGGGGLYLAHNANANIRDSTFIENEATEGATGDKHGHQIFTEKDGESSPSLTIVNTQFTHIAGNNAFYGDAGYFSPTTCSAQEPCSVAPFTGACTDLGDEGTTCDINCPSGSYAPSKEAVSCLPHTTCGNQVDGTTTRLTGANGTEAGTCADCDSGSFSASATEDCIAHKTTCPDNEYLSGGTTTVDKDCLPCAADEKSYGGAPCKKVVDCLSATEQGHRNIDVGYASGDYTVSMS